MPALSLDEITFFVELSGSAGFETISNQVGGRSFVKQRAFWSLLTDE